VQECEGDFTMLENVRFVLINTSHPGNIGACARALKTMELSNWCLVEPKQFPHVKASEMASGALDMLTKVKVADTLSEAISDSHLVIGTSARSRSLPWPMLSPRELAEKIVTENLDKKVAILFGRENSGLTNEELQRCHFHVQIPANPEYSSLNIAAAVQIIAYELHIAKLSQKEPPAIEEASELVTEADLSRFFEHLEKVLVQIQFLNPQSPRQLMARLIRVFHRANLDTVEMNILRGILTAVEKHNLV